MRVWLLWITWGATHKTRKGTSATLDPLHSTAQTRAGLRKRTH